MKVKDLIYAGYRNAQILVGPQQTYSADDAADGLEVLNAMVDTWKADNLTVYAILRSLFNLVAGKGSESNPYTIGLNGNPDWKIERPEKVFQASYILENSSPSVEQQLEILTLQEYQALSPKDLTGPIPTKLYYRPTVPNGQVIIWAVPTIARQIALYLWQTVNEFPDADEEVFLPPAYREAIEYNLALRLAGRYPEARLTAVCVEMAKTSLGKLKTINAPVYLMQCEMGALGVVDSKGRYNIFSNRKV